MLKRDIKFITKAQVEAKKSSFHKEHLGCVAVYNGRVVATGHNSEKTHPEQMIYNEYRRFKNNNGIRHSLHAEMMCLTNLETLIQNGNVVPERTMIYICRLRKRTPYGLARPCEACMHKIKDLGIKKICYTTNDGLAIEEVF